MPKILFFIGLLLVGFTVSCQPETTPMAEPLTAEFDPAEDALQLVELYRKQLDFFDLYRNEKDTAILQKFVYENIFRPHRYVLSECFGYDSIHYFNAQMDLAQHRQDDIRSAMQFYEDIRFDSLLRFYETNYSEKVGYPVTGKFYFSFFHQRHCNFCGCDKESMQMDLLNENNLNEQHLRILLPHELTHNVFEVQQNDTAIQEVFLYKAIDEGFANYVAQRVAGVSVEEAFGMSRAEFDWFAANEERIKAQVRPVLFSEVEEDWDPYSESVADRVIEGSPGSVGYFVGYRIVEDYLKNTDQRDWRVVFRTPVRELLEKSRWLE